MTWLSVTLAGTLAGACLAVALVHGLRAARVRGPQVPGELAHLAMALGMAAMFAPLHDPVPSGAWALVFGATAAGALVTTLRERTVGGEAGHRLVGSVAMLFMLLVGHQTDGQAWGAPVAIVLGGACAWHALRCAERLHEPAPDAASGQTGSVAVAVAPRPVVVGDIVVAVAMSAMVLGAV